MPRLFSYIGPSQEDAELDMWLIDVESKLESLHVWPILGGV